MSNNKSADILKITTILDNTTLNTTDNKTTVDDKTTTDDKTTVDNKTTTDIKTLVNTFDTENKLYFIITSDENSHQFGSFYSSLEKARSIMDLMILDGCQDDIYIFWSTEGECLKYAMCHNIVISHVYCDNINV